MNSLARLEGDQDWLQPIPGQPPSLISRPPGCAFHPRCVLSQGRTRCRTEVPPLREVGAPGHLSACHYAEELTGAVAPVSAAHGAS
jgi:oligopeptide/dipeptide ABC transporter ATP-binding protein